MQYTKNNNKYILEPFYLQINLGDGHFIVFMIESGVVFYLTRSPGLREFLPQGYVEPQFSLIVNIHRTCKKHTIIP